MRKKGKTLKNLLLAGTLFASLFNATPAIAEEPKQPPKIEINLDYEIEDKNEIMNYTKSYVSLYPALEKVYTGDINSYPDLVGHLKSLSENEKINWLAAIGGALARGSYDYSLPHHEVFSQDFFFGSLQNYLQTGDKNLLGVCRHIASHIEQLANDIGIRAAAVTGIRNGGGHVYTILKTENGTTIVDYDGILSTGTKNIEKALEADQKDADAVAFEHSFFEDNQFKYKLITKDGKKFLNFVGYDGTSDSLKNSLFCKNNLNPNSSITLGLGDYLTSLEMNIFGFFGKVGEIKGDESSFMNKMTIAQAGYKNTFLIPEIASITLNASFISGNFPEKDSGIGATCELAIASDNKEGLSLAARIAGNIFGLPEKKILLFHDFLIGAGASYKIPVVKEFNIEPYALARVAITPTDIGTWALNPIFDEFKAGAIFDFKFPELEFSIDPYYSIKPWEQEFGGNFKIGNKYFNLTLDEYITLSHYDFCPNKNGFTVGLNLTLNKNIELKLGIKNDQTNYDGEIEDNHSLSVQAGIKL